MGIGSEYAYSFGRVKALEASLIDSSQFKRMAEAPTASDAIKILSETTYALPEDADISAIENVLLEELKSVYDLAQRISPRKEITNLLQLKYDFHNAKILLKSEIASKEPAFLVSLGIVDIEKLKKAFKERIRDLPEPLARAVEKARLAFEESSDTQIIDTVMDQVYVCTLLEDSEKSPFLQEFFRLKTDLENIRNFVRSQKFKVSFSRMYLQGGTIDFKTFQTFQDEPLEAVAKAFGMKKYSRVVEEGLKSFEETGELTVYERLVEDFLIEYVKQAKMVVLGIEPLIGYILAKEREVKLIRLILLGKLKGIDFEKRMSGPYV